MDHEAKIRIRFRITPQMKRVSRVIRNLNLHTVCEESLCPNISQCWNAGSATFMILGDICTRGCRFCAVKKGIPKPPDQDEHMRIAEAVRRLGLRYVTITSVTRDDLPDGGAHYFSKTVRAVKRVSDNIRVEVLTPDFKGDKDSILMVASSGVDVYAHNIETVERLTPIVRDPRASYEQSLNVLDIVKEFDRCIITKSSILLGLGEEKDEVVEAMKDLRSVGVGILVLSQYLRPTPRQLPVAKIYKYSEFKELEEIAKRMGFAYVVAHPLARTSYRALEAYEYAKRRLKCS